MAPSRSHPSGDAGPPRDDDELFREATAGAKPLANRDRAPLQPKPGRRRTKRPSTLIIEGGDGEFAARGEGVSREVLRELRAGRIRPEATLDLHGMSVAQVDVELRRFLANSARLRRRCVLIIHGKGNHSESGIAVLGEHVARQLGGPLASFVHATTSAHRRDGGSGALYVMVHR